MMDYGNYGEHMTTAGWVFMSLGMLILVVLLVALVMWIMSQRGRPDGGQSPRSNMSAREVLDHRLASGEVTADQYDQLRKRLDPAAPPGTDSPSAPPAGAPG
jgi:uncharacterized membrane protein